MRQRTLGASGIGVSAIGLGCWEKSGSYGPADEVESVAIQRNGRSGQPRNIPITPSVSRLVGSRSTSEARR